VREGGRSPAKQDKGKNQLNNNNNNKGKASSPTTPTHNSSTRERQGKTKTPARCFAARCCFFSSFNQAVSATCT